MPTIAFPGYDVLVASDALDRTGDIARHVADAHRFAIITDDAVSGETAAMIEAAGVKLIVAETAVRNETLPFPESA